MVYLLRFIILLHGKLSDIIIPVPFFFCDAPAKTPTEEKQETFDRLKSINPDIKVILSSGYSLNGEALGIMARGCHSFIQKPTSAAGLSQKIREVLDNTFKTLQT